MTTIERTAYPRFRKNRPISKNELEDVYSPSGPDLRFVNESIKGDNPNLKLNMMILLKSFQRLGYFPKLTEVPDSVVRFIRKEMGISTQTPFQYDVLKTKYRHFKKIRKYLGVNHYDRLALRHCMKTIADRATVIDNPADLINIAIEELIQKRYELPAFSHLNRLARHIRHAVNSRIHQSVFDAIHTETREKLSLLLNKSGTDHFTHYHRLKQYPKNPTLHHLKELITHIEWLESLGNFEEALKPISLSKIQCFATESRVLDASEIKAMSTHKQMTLLVSFIHQTKIQTRDNISEMMIRRVSKFHKKAKDELDRLRASHQEKTEALIETLRGVLLNLSASERGSIQKWKAAEQHLQNQGGVEHLINECEQVSAYNGNNYLPLLWKYYGSHRPTLFQLARVLEIESTTQDYSLIRALTFMLENQHKRVDLLDIESPEIMSFASENWKRLILKKDGTNWFVYRRHFEVCVFSCVAAELQSLDLFIKGSDSFSDYRDQLLPIEECEVLLSEYCAAIGVPNTADGLVDFFKNELTTVANEVDQSYPKNTSLEIDSNGIPVLRKLNAKKLSPSAKRLIDAIHKRMPERNILDILVNAMYWVNFIRHFGPASGHDPKLANKIEQYVITIFAYGCNLGATQAARHLKGEISPHMIQFVNKRHINAKKLDLALKDVINVYNEFDLPKTWGNPKAGIADGTQYDLYEENLFAESHIRYGGYGGIAYQHISDTYVALFSHFIPCGVWEAVYIIEGLLKNTSDIQIDTIYADTQGQSTTVFAVAYLLGIQLEPRIRNWKDLKFFKPDKHIKYQNIDSLFGDNVINWESFRRHFKDIFQVILSIKAGKISSAVLLRKLSTYSRKNKLYQAFRELGYVIRTLFLLRYISDTDKQQTIISSTTKVETFHKFCKWFFFGSLGIISSNYYDEQEKAIKYNSLIANIVMLQNVVDMSSIIQQLESEGMEIKKEDLSHLSPYPVSQVKRFGDYAVNLNITPPGLHKFQKLFGNTS